MVPTELAVSFFTLLKCSLESLSFNLQSDKYGSEERWKDIFSFLVETMEAAVRSWHETSSVDAKVYYLLDKEKTDTEKYAPIVNIDKVLAVYCLLLHFIYSCT